MILAVFMWKIREIQASETYRDAEGVDVVGPDAAAEGGQEVVGETEGASRQGATTKI